MKYTFPSSLRLRHRYQFRRFVRDSQCRVGQSVIVEFRRGRNADPKLGITVTRKYGKAHERNRFKRIVREAFRLIQNRVPAGFEIHVKPRSGAYGASMWGIQQELLVLIPLMDEGPKGH